MSASISRITARLRRSRWVVTIVAAIGLSTVFYAQSADSFNPGVNSTVEALAVQPDGKILAGGFFVQMGGGGTGTTARRNLGRLNADGSLDASFDPGAGSGVKAFAVQPDGKIVVGGQFTTLGGGGFGTTARNYIGRLNADGSIDASFNPGANATVYALAIQPDGKILVGGAFTSLGGGGTTERRHIGRLNADGSLDTTFNPGMTGELWAFAVQPDGKIVVGGSFTMIGGGGSGTTARNFIARLNADGSLDTSFSPGTTGIVYTLAIQPDGKILVGGFFESLTSGVTTVPCHAICRVNPDGSADASFNPGANHLIYSMALQADGKIVVGGFFTRLGGTGGTGTTTRNYIGRLLPDGSLDTFDPGAEWTVRVLALQADGGILAGGDFVRLGGGGTGVTARQHIGRVTNSDAAVQSLSATGSAVSWSRSGGGPEVWRVTFESSPDGTAYTPLGSGTRVAGGWQLLGQHLPTNQNVYVRARGYYGGGSSTSIVQSVAIVNIPGAPMLDLNGDNSGDAFVYKPSTGSWRRETSQGGGGFSGINGGWSPGWTLQPARFNNDLLTDMFVFSTTTGQWFKMLNNGAGGFTAQSDGGWWPGWQRHVMDLDGDGISDLFLYDPASGQWFKCISTPTGFTYFAGGWSPGWQPYPLNLNGDSRDDLFLINPTTGQWVWVQSESGGNFSYPVWGAWAPGWNIYPADFNGDGLSDVLLHNPVNGQYYVCLNNGAGFTYQFGSWALGWTPYIVDLDGNQVADLFLYHASGQWFEALSDGLGHFSFVGTGGWSPNWQIYPTDFNGDGRTDLLLYSPTTGQYFQAWNFNVGAFSYFSGGWDTGLTIIVGKPVR